MAGIVGAMPAIAAGLALYALLVLALHGLPAADVPINALKAVVPGFAAGWLQSSRGLTYGAMVGALGGLLEVGLVVFADLPLGIPDQLALAAAYTVAGSALTSALGGAAGESLRARRKGER
jgi:hypothetical protein